MTQEQIKTRDRYIATFGVDRDAALRATVARQVALATRNNPMDTAIAVFVGLSFVWPERYAH